MSIYLGIDFGTSTNYITRWYKEDGSVKSVPNMDPIICTGDTVFPNVIYYKPGRKYIVGKLAEKNLLIDPENGISGVKRKFIENDFKYNIPSLEFKYSPVEVATDIFKYIRDRVSENNGGEDIDGVVISVPYSYGNRERLKIKTAAERAELPVIDLIEEPVAAAMSYGIFNKKSTMGHSENIMIFDFGGGTLDITIFRYSKSPEEKIYVEVLNTEGIQDFGGKVIDDILLSKILEKLNIDIRNIENKQQRTSFYNEMISKVVEIKEDYQYMEDEEAEIFDSIAGIDVDVSISDTEIENWMRGAGVQEKLRMSINDALINSGDKGLDPEDIDKILLVGGSSNLTFVKKEIEKIFYKEPEEFEGIEKDKLVGFGAGLYCGMKIKDDESIKIIQKLSYSIGVRIGTKFDRLIEKNEVYGTFSKPKEYSLMDKSNSRDIEIYQGNSTDITKCFLIGKISVEDLVLDDDSKVEISLGTDKKGMVVYELYINGKCVKSDNL